MRQGDKTRLWDPWEIWVLRNNPLARPIDLADVLGRSCNAIRGKRQELKAYRTLDGVRLSWHEKLIRVIDAKTGEVVIPLTTFRRASRIVFYSPEGLKTMYKHNKKGIGNHPYIIEEVIPEIITQ